MSVHQFLNRARAPRRQSARRFEYRYEAVLGTSLELQIRAAKAKCAQLAERKVLAEVERLGAILSTYVDTSEFARWQKTFGIDVPISDELAELLERAEGWRVRTAGAFNPTVKAIVDALQQSIESRESCRVVEQLILDATQPLWVVDRQAGRARRLTKCLATLDAIAKGFIVSAAALRGLETPGIRDVLLNIGGDVQHYGEREVLVRITDPFCPADNAAPVAVVRIREQALATSGGYRRRIVIGGRSRSHLVDPLTGCSAELVRGASVIASDCTTADVLSTAFSILSPDQSMAMADSMPGVACLLVLADGSLRTSTRWANHDVSGSSLSMTS